MKKINLIFFLLLSGWTIQAQVGMSLEKLSGVDAFTVHYDGRVNAYESISSHSSTNDAFWANMPADDGIHITDAGNRGVYVINSASDGVYIQNAGSRGLVITYPVSEALRVDGGTSGLFTSNATVDGVQVAFPLDDGLHIQDPGDDGVYITGAGGHGVEVNAGVTGLYLHDQQNHGVYSYNTGLEAGFFRNAASSNTSALYAAHLDDTKWDIGIGGNARVRSDGQFSLQLDQNDNSSGSTHDYFEVLASAAQGGTFKMWIYETGNGGVTGSFAKAGGSFKIDHPLDPENKYLYHSFVESPDMMNVYNGNVALDENGEATVKMEDWFETLNKEYRYQLTPIGGAAMLYIGEEISNGMFKIAGGKPNMKVSWQVTGIRQDAWAGENRIEVEVEKEAFNKGKYLHPKAWSKRSEGQQLQYVTLHDPKAANQDIEYDKATKKEFQQHENAIKKQQKEGDLQMNESKIK